MPYRRLFATRTPRRPHTQRPRFLRWFGILCTIAMIVLIFVVGVLAAEGGWTQVAKLLAVSGVSDDYFGWSVASSGNTVVVGAIGENNYQGAVYVYEKPAGGWAAASVTQTARLTASDSLANDNFGFSVVLSGDTVMVGAWGNANSKGAVYVFEKPIGGWVDMTQTAKLMASDGLANDSFGYSVALSEDVLVAGANYDTIGGNVDQGSAYIFEKGAGWVNGSANQAGKLTASDGAQSDQFGSSVAIYEDTVVVGARHDDNFRGSAHVFEKPGGGWTDMTQTARLTASDGVANDSFGESVAVNGDTVVVGADRYASSKGAVYIFEKPAGGWPVFAGAYTTKLSASDGEANDSFGKRVAQTEEMVVVGAYNDTVGSNNKQGSAYIFEKPAGGWAASTSAHAAKLVSSDGTGSDTFGFSVALSGDYVIVGATGDESRRGSAYIFNSQRTQANDGGADDNIASFKIGSVGGTFTYGPVKVLFPQLSLSIFEVDAPSAGNNIRLGNDGRVFDIIVRDYTGKVLSEFDFPIGVCIKPSSSELSAAGGNQNLLNIFHKHEGAEWDVLDTFVDGDYVCATVNKFSLFGLGVPQVPETGFAPDVVVDLPEQPAEKVFIDLARGMRDAEGGASKPGDFSLSIPALSLELPIVGVPLTLDGWDVSWLGEAAGYLEGTAFPTWAGNTALTAHVWNADNTPGPFVDLHTLRHGDQIIIDAWGQKHVYEVRTTQEVSPDDLRFLPHSNYDILTLITCQGYDQSSGMYDLRLVVRSVLIRIE